jgi:hypothetical protein
MSLLRVAGLAITVFFAGCDVLAPACTDDLQVVRSPADTTIRVGQDFTPFFQFRGCRGRRVLSDDLTFTSTDQAVLSVDAQSGRATALAPGNAKIEITGARYGGRWPIAVTVVP